MTVAVRKKDDIDVTFDIPDDVFDMDEEVDTFKKERLAQNEKRRKQEIKRKTQKKSVKVVGASDFSRTIMETQDMIRDDNWENAAPRHLVALFAIAHRNVYGVDCAELTPSATHQSAFRVTKQADNHFDGDIKKLAAFYRWVWVKEIGLEKWRKEKGISRGRIRPCEMFGIKFITAYKIHMRQETTKPNGIGRGGRLI